MTAADALTVFRAFAGIPIVVLHARGDAEIAFALFVAAATSDAVDGWLARRLGGSTTYGRLLDPLADKALVLCTLLALGLTRRVDPLLAAALAAREIAVAGARLTSYRRGEDRPAGWGTKLKTLCEMVGLAALLARPQAPEALGASLLWVALALGLVTLPGYLAPLRRRPLG